MVAGADEAWSGKRSGVDGVPRQDQCHQFLFFVCAGGRLMVTAMFRVCRLMG